MNARNLSRFVAILVAGLSLAIGAIAANAEIIVGISFPSQEGAPGSTNSPLDNATNVLNHSTAFFLLNPALSSGRTGEVVVVTQPDFGSASTSHTTFESITTGALSVTLIRNSLKLDWPADHIGWILQTRTYAPGDPISSRWFRVDGSSATNQVELMLDRANSSVSFRLVAP